MLARSSGSIQNFCVTPEQLETCISEIILAIVTANVPFSFIENKHFQTAMSTLGWHCPVGKCWQASGFPSW
jgi:hypothetical protein